MHRPRYIYISYYTACKVCSLFPACYQRLERWFKGGDFNCLIILFFCCSDKSSCRRILTFLCLHTYPHECDWWYWVLQLFSRYGVHMSVVRHLQSDLSKNDSTDLEFDLCKSCLLKKEWLLRGNDVKVNTTGKKSVPVFELSLFGGKRTNKQTAKRKTTTTKTILKLKVALIKSDHILI